MDLKLNSRRRRVIYGTFIVCMWVGPFPGFWLAASLWVEVFLYKYQLQISFFVENSWDKACFIFVCQLNDGWDPYGKRCYCYYSTSPPPPSHMGNSFSWGKRSSFKPGWVCESNLDNAQAVFTSIIVDGWVVFDGGCDNLIPLSMVYGIGVLGLWYLLGFGVGGWGKALGIGSEIAGISSFLRDQQFGKVFISDASPLIQYWWFQSLDLLCHISRCSVFVLQLFLPFEGGTGCTLCGCITVWDQSSDKADSSHNLHAPYRVWVGMVWSHVASDGAAITWVLEKCHVFVMGCLNLIVVTDHEPLKNLFGDMDFSKI